MRMERQTLLTEGKVTHTLLKFSFPFLLANILQALYGTSDLFMVGRFSDSAGVSAVATGGQIMQTITGLSIGLTTGGTVLIGQYYGAKRGRDVVNAVKTVFWVFGALSVAMTCGTVLLLDPICRMMQVPPEAYDLTKEYLFLCSLGIVFIVGYNALSGVLRGLGDSKTPLLFIAIACVINVSTDVLFVGAFKLGAPGAAVSTVIAQAASLLLAGCYLASKSFLKKYKSARPCFRLYAAKGMLSAGLPIACQEGLVNLSFLIITSMVNGMGLIASAALGVTEKLIVFSMLPATAFASAIAAITAQHKGAGLMTRARKCLQAGIAAALVFGVSCFLWAQWDASALVSFFTGDPLVIEAGSQYLRSYSIDCILVCFVFCMNSFFSGSGHTVFPLVHSAAATFLVRIPLSYFMSRPGHSSMFLLGFAAPAATLFSLLLCQYYLEKHYQKEPIRMHRRFFYADNMKKRSLPG